jgi:predicted site-specific integrase-resolvase
MSMLGDNWCTVEEAESKFGISRDLLLEWVREGIVRSEDKDGNVSRVNLDDLELKVREDRL